MTATTFYHETVLLQEAVDGLAIRPDGVYVDATFGGGGHSRLILSKLGPQGRLIAFDQDADAWNNLPDDARLTPVKENFRYMKRFLRLHGAPQVNGILADLGVSSWQFDTAARGFSTRFDGPLDMRMDQRMQQTAADILSNYSEAELHRIFELYGEVRNARQLAKHIVTVRRSTPIHTIGSLKATLEQVIKGNPQRYLAQLFQALRIEVNQELQSLEELLVQSAGCLLPGGRLSVITFHSLEDRIVKHFIKSGSVSGNTSEGNETASSLIPVHKKPLEPGEAEIRRNPRSRSARLRIAEKTEADA